ncbi:putative nucleic acid-binding protein [Azospirillum brasilense]|uniref:Ribonuclease VapC n=1 Tax=Azospirillum brasilense TaxID=192 RepID=A0A560CBY9_AZOBR|nr:type II toxin-antitoxin system VapC family toxin [Azospirillum brasilense]TWA82379.1 putative nucleic acid-binding protein [Azospirillum brasilense]
MARPVSVAGQAVVVDASVAVKWIIREDASSDALAFLAQERPLLAPDILLIEVAAALAKRVHTGTLETSDADTLLGRLRGLVAQLPLTLTPAVDVAERALDLSGTLRHPLVDCLYLALAWSKNAGLVTADRKLAEVAARSGLPGLVRIGPAT